jgi:hypothetical protein
VKHTGKLVKEDSRKQNARNDVLRPVIVNVRCYDAVSSSCITEVKDMELMQRHVCCVKIFMTGSYSLPYDLMHALLPLLYLCLRTELRRFVVIPSVTNKFLEWFSKNHFYCLQIHTLNPLRNMLLLRLSSYAMIAKILKLSPLEYHIGASSYPVWWCQCCRIFFFFCHFKIGKQPKVIPVRG